jgi:hypothetical protein
MHNKANMIAIGLTTAGIIFFMAMAFQILPWNYAIFAGVSCFILAGAIRRYMAQTKE